MTTFKDTNIKWLLKIPNDWEIKKLKYIFTYITGATPSSGKSEYYNGGNHNWITISDLDGRYTGKSKNTLTDKAVQDSNMRIVPKGSLLYSFKLSVGQMAFVSEDTYTNEAIFAVLEKEGLNLNFWYYALGSYFISNANENIYGAKIFNQFVIDNGFLIVPTLDTQTTIANFLDSKTDKISTFIKNKKETIKLLQEQKQSIIHKAATKGIDEGVEMKDSGIEWIGKIPKNWKIKRLKYLLIDTVDNRGRTPEVQIEGIPLLEVNAINKTINPNTLKITKHLSIDNYKNFVRKELNVGDILFVTVGATIGKTCIIPKEFNYCILQNIVGFRFNKKNFNSKLFLYITYVDGFREYYKLKNKINTLDSIKVSIFINEYLPIPEIKEQEKIIKYLEKETNLIDMAISKIESEIQLIEEYKDSLIYNAVTGKINI